MADRVAEIRPALRRRMVSDRWSQVFGIASGASLLILLVTGVVLMFFYEPSGALTTYRGSYRPLSGVVMSKAYASTLHVSLEVRGGLLVRQMHHWAALLLPASLTVQLMDSFFTGHYRRPRRVLWVLLVGVVVVVLAGGWSGYALPDDMLAGTGLQITQGVTLAIPFVGSTTARLLFGGSYPGHVIEHLYPIHVVVVPVLLIALLALRAGLWWRTPPRPRRQGRRVVDTGIPLYPTAAIQTLGVAFIVAAVVTFMAATATVSPVWLYGPADPTNASAGSQPDWYTGFLDGALRLVPSGWELTWWDRTWTLAVVAPLGVVTMFMLLVLLYPFIEERITKDHREHNALERLRDAPTRTALGLAGIVFYCILWAAAGADIIATGFHVSFESVIQLLQLLLFLGPPAAFVLARAICLGLQDRERQDLVTGAETGRIIRLPSGGYTELHRRVPAAPAHDPGRASQARLARADTDRRGEHSSVSDKDAIRRAAEPPRRWPA